MVSYSGEYRFIDSPAVTKIVPNSLVSFRSFWGWFTPDTLLFALVLAM